MSIRRRFLARLAAAVVALALGAGTVGTVSFDTDRSSDSTEEAGATWSSFRGRR